jgi:hypothetical protein
MNPTFPTRLSTPYTDGQYRIYPNSLLFKSGNYPDKQFSMTTAEIAAAASGFDAPVKVNLEHAPTVLKDKLGEVRAAYVDPNAPEELRGVVAIPRWLDDQLTDAERQVSSEFNRETKRLIGLALTPTPRVEGAALMAAFNTFTDSSTTAEPGRGEARPAARSGERSKSMSFMEKLKALFKAEGIEVEDTPGVVVRGLSPVTHPETESLKAELSTLKAELAEFKKTPEKKVAVFSETDAKAKASEFVAELLTAHKCLPAEREPLEAMYVAAFRADCAVASFSGETLNTPTLEAFKASQKARPAHLLTTELLVDTSEDAVLFAYGKEGKPETAKPKTPDEIYAAHNRRNDATLNGISMNGGH